MSTRAGGLLTLLWAVLCIGAGGVVVFEWLHPPRLKQPIAPPGQVASGIPEVTPSKGFAIPPVSQYSEIIERPLFLTDRRPVHEEAPPPEAPLPEPPKDEKLTLLGVVLAPDITMALVQDDKTGKVARLRIGEQVNGWQLQSVQINRISLSSGGAVLELPLERNKRRPPPRNRLQEVRRRVPPATNPAVRNPGGMPAKPLTQ